MEKAMIIQPAVLPYNRAQTMVQSGSVISWRETREQPSFLIERESVSIAGGAPRSSPALGGDEAASSRALAVGVRVLPALGASLQKAHEGLGCNYAVDLWAYTSNVSLVARTALGLTDAYRDISLESVRDPNLGVSSGIGLTSIAPAITGIIGFTNANADFKNAKKIGDITGALFAKLAMFRSGIEMITGFVMAGVRTLSLTGAATAGRVGEVFSKVLGNLSSGLFSLLFVCHIARIIKSLSNIIPLQRKLSKMDDAEAFAFLQAQLDGSDLAKEAEYKRTFGPKSLKMLQEGKPASEVVAQAKKEIKKRRNRELLLLVTMVTVVAGLLLTTAYSAGLNLVVGYAMMLLGNLIIAIAERKALLKNLKHIESLSPYEKALMISLMLLTIVASVAGSAFSGGGTMLYVALGVSAFMIGAQAKGMYQVWRKPVTIKNRSVNLSVIPVRTDALITQ